MCFNLKFGRKYFRELGGPGLLIKQEKKTGLKVWKCIEDGLLDYSNPPLIGTPPSAK